MASALDLADIPYQDELVIVPAELSEKEDAKSLAWLVSRVWNEYLTRLHLVLSQAARVINSVALTQQGASISATDFSGGAISAGLYRVCPYIRITRAAGTSSSVELTIDWTDGAVAQTHTFAAVTGNTTQAKLDGPPLLLRADKNSAIRYSTVYTSAGAPAAQHSLYLTLERLKKL